MKRQEQPLASFHTSDLHKRSQTPIGEHARELLGRARRDSEVSQQAFTG